jgi:nucleoside-diphosphate-sugar epimerase
MKQISILGCGWLGLPLAISLLENGCLIKGSTTSKDKVSQLISVGIDAHHIEVLETEIIGAIDSFLHNSEILIINIPPKLRNASSKSFINKMNCLIPFIEKPSVQKVIFISSTSVYSDTNSMDLITEKTISNPDTESGKQLLETEYLLQNNPNFKTTVIRFGGLIGEDRHPVKFLAGRENLENPEAPINLIHQTDCVGIIETIIEQDCFNEIFNAVAPFHPTRKEYYSQKAQELNLQLPKFEDAKPSVGKIISSEKVALILNYEFQKRQL